MTSRFSTLLLLLRSAALAPAGPGPRPARSGARLPALAILLALCLAVLVSHPETASSGRELYVAVAGQAGNDGTLTRPLDLATALSATSPARPGDTIWLRGGTYRGPFTSRLIGTSSQPITLRQYPGERAILDGVGSPTSSVLTVNGAYAIYWGFEITNTDPNRRNGVNSRGAGLDIFGPNTTFINLIVHDAQTGVGFWSPATNAELYGTLIYDNGVEGSDRGHGHALYTQNATGTKRIVDNILFNSFSFGIHAYTEGGAIDNFLFEGNVSFNNGVLSAVSGAKSNLLLGGSKVARNAVVRSNYTYFTQGSGGRGADLGYGTACDAAQVQDNFFVGTTAINLSCSNTTFSSNRLYGQVAGSTKTAFPSNTYLNTRPSGAEVYVRPNQYEPGRSTIVAYNWGLAPQVSVSLAGTGLQAGDTFEVRDAQNFFGPPVASGTYTGTSVVLPMSGLTPATAVGNVPITPVHTAPEFGVFIVLPRGSTTTTRAVPTAVRNLRIVPN